MATVGVQYIFPNSHLGMRFNSLAAWNKAKYYVRRDGTVERIDSAPVPRVKFQGLLLSSLAPSAKNLPFVSHFALKGCCQDSKQARTHDPLRTCNIMPNVVARKLTNLLCIRQLLG